jgi:hypothetical protein
MQRTRREFLSDVSRGALIAGLGAGAAGQMGVSAAFADRGPESLSFGRLEPLVALMQETPAAKLLPILVDKLKSGTDLKDLTAAAALANVRTFGGEDYIGFHTMMAISPAYRMALQMPVERRALPVLKVLYRNSSRIQALGGRSREVLKPVAPGKAPEGAAGTQALLEAVHKKDVAAAEATFAALATSPEDAFNHVFQVVEEGQEVHRVVMPYRAYDLLDIVGREHAHTMLRQSVRYCVKQESPRITQYFGAARTALAKLLDQHKLSDRPAGTRTADDGWIEKTADAIFRGPSSQSAGVVAQALAEGFDPAVIGEAVSVAANQLVLRDQGRRANEVGTDKPIGSVHGDSLGVHACDSANAWRNMSRVANARNRAACLILGAWQVAKDGTGWQPQLVDYVPYPHAPQLAKLTGKDPQQLLAEAEDAIRNKDQAGAAAAIHLYCEAGVGAEPAFQLLLKYAVSEDGALHAEKYFRTVAEEYRTTREKFRSRQLVALARVTASEFGKPAPGYADACRLIGVS